MIKELQNKLKRQWETFTTSEQKIAAYLLHNISGIPFETAASLGQRVGVSPMTVGRFLRNLGYARSRRLKKSLRGERALVAAVQESRACERSGLCRESLQDRDPRADRGLRAGPNRRNGRPS